MGAATFPLTALALTALAGLPAAGQEAPLGAGGDLRLLESPEANHLLTSAEQAVRRGDWKVAIDALQRLQRGAYPVLLSSDGQIFESASRYARRRLCQLPPAGLDAYRLLYDAEAAALYKQALAAHDERLLRRIVEEYLPSSWADDAANALAAWYLDENRPAEALAVLDDVLEMHPDPDVPRGVLEARRLIAEAMLGEAPALSGAGLSDGGAIASVLGPRRFEMLSEFVTTRARPTGGGSDVLGGVAEVASPFGQLPPVRPTLSAEVVRRTDLPGGRQFFVPDLPALQEQTGRPLMMGMVADRDRLYVRGLYQIAAFDLATLDPLWVSAPPTDWRMTWAAFGDVPVRVIAVAGGEDYAIVQDSRGLQQRLVLDGPGGMVTLAAGRLFAIDRFGESPAPPHDPALDGDPGAGAGHWPPPRTADALRIVGSRLIALDPSTGRLLWSRGRSADARDPLGAVQFLGPAVDFGEHVAALYRDQQVLGLAVLDPASGALVRRVYLCGLDERWLPTYESARPAAGRRLAWVAPGGGLVFAVDVRSAQVVWASRYVRDNLPPAEESAGRSRVKGYRMLAHWVESRPVSLGPLVVVTPPDSTRVHALDAHTGRVRWSLPAPPGSYVVGARGGCVLIGGPELICIAVRDGTVRWRHALDVGLRGRAILSGGHVYVPAARELRVFSADEGRLLETIPLPPGEQALNNVLAWAGALYSVDGLEVRRFPDTADEYERLAALRRSGSLSLRDGLRLAELEMHRGRPRDALALLEDLGRAETGDSAWRRLVREATLAAARDEDVPPAEAADLLERLVREDDPLAQWQAQMVAAEILVRLGRPDEAYSGLTSLLGQVLSASEGGASGRLLPAGQHLQQSVTCAIAQRLAALAADLDAGQRARLRAEHEETWAAAARRADLAQMAALAIGAVDDRLRAKAMLAMAHRAAAAGRYEQAVALCDRIIAGDVSAETAAAAHALRAWVLTDPECALVSLAEPSLAALELGCADAVVDGPPWPGGLPRAFTGAELARRLRPRAQAIRRQWLDRPAPRSEWTRQYEGIFLPVRVGGPHSRELDALVAVLLLPPLELLAPDTPRAETLQVYRAFDGDVAWQVELPGSEAAASEQGGSALSAWSSLEAAFGLGGVDVAPAVQDGPVLVVALPGGLAGVGAATGRMLWRVPATAGWQQGRGDFERWFDASGGRCVFVAGPGQVAAVRTETGERIWQRRGAVEHFALVRCEGEVAYVMSASGERVEAIDVGTGRRLRVYEFGETTVRGRPAPPEGWEPGPVLVRGDGAPGRLSGWLVGPSGDGISALRLSDGAEAWHVPLGVNVTALGVAQDRYVVAGLTNGRVLVIDGETGRTQATVVLPDVLNGVFDVVASGDLAVVGWRVSDDRRNPMRFAGIDPRDGRVLWDTSLTGLGDDLAQATRLRNILRIMPDAIPIVLDASASDMTPRLPMRRQAFPTAVGLVDMQTGRLLGRPTSFESVSDAHALPIATAGSQYLALYHLGGRSQFFGRVQTMQVTCVPLAGVEARPRGAGDEGT